MREVTLTQARVAWIDDEFNPEIDGYGWHFSQKIGYAVRNDKQLMMHQVVIGIPASGVIDHIDGNKLNNCRKNLRIVTNAQNVRYRHVLNSNNTSAYKGVSYTYVRHARQRYELVKPWMAKVTFDRWQIYLGRYTTKEEAATAYDVVAEFYFKEFATFNLAVGDRIPSAVQAVQKYLRRKE